MCFIDRYETRRAGTGVHFFGNSGNHQTIENVFFFLKRLGKYTIISMPAFSTKHFVHQRHFYAIEVDARL